MHTICGCGDLMGNPSPVPIPNTWNLRTLAQLNTTYPPAYYRGQMAFLPTGAGENDELYRAIENFSGVVEWIKIGEVGETEMVVALPVAVVENEGQILTLTAAPGSRTRSYICLKSDSNAYSWVEFANGGV